MNLRRFLVVVGLLLGLLVMHALAPGRPTLEPTPGGSMASMTVSGQSMTHAPAAVPGRPAVPSHHDGDTHVTAACVAVLGLPGLWLLLAFGLAVVLARPHRLALTGQAGWSRERSVPHRPPDLGQLCVLRI